MTAVADDPRLARLLEHPALWRGRSAARLNAVPTGFHALDAALPGGGWPQIGLVEILISRIGVGELYLLLPALASLTGQAQARWCAWIAPAEPFAERGGTRPDSGARSAGDVAQSAGDGRRPCRLEPFAPALAAHGVNLSRVLVVRAGNQPAGALPGRREPLWACEQALRSGACDVVVAWMQRVPVRALRRLQLATERGRTLAFLFRGLSARAVREPSAAVLRIAVQPVREGTRITVLKSRSSLRGAIYLSLHGACEGTEGKTAGPAAGHTTAYRSPSSGRPTVSGRSTVSG